jgi:undecaprenyl phosphate-alpha-L-ara4FN deformylase
MDGDALYAELKKGYDLLARILGKPPTCSAVPGWKCNEAVLLAKSRFPFDYNSDCRGKSIFRPIAGDGELLQPQIPVTLPTYDEVVGRNGVTDSNYNDYMLSLLDPAKLNVLTVHAEVEGIARLEMFDQFMRRACSKGFSFVPLKVLLEECPQSDPVAVVARGIPGRQGWVCYQSDSSILSPESRIWGAR